MKSNHRLFGCVIVVMVSASLFTGIFVSKSAGESAGCTQVDFVEPENWDDHYRHAVGDFEQSYLRAAGQAFDLVGSTFDLNAERVIGALDHWRYLDMADIAWHIFGRSEFGDIDLYFLKPGDEPHSFDQPENVSTVALIYKADGAFAQLTGSGRLTVGSDV